MKGTLANREYREVLSDHEISAQSPTFFFNRRYSLIKDS